MRRKISKNIDVLVLDKEVGYFKPQDGEEDLENRPELSRKKKRFWNKLNTIQRSRRTALLRKVLANEEVD